MALEPQMKSFVRRVHFVGIGGVGMSGIAQVLLNLGYSVSGSDIKETEVTRRLQRAGARVRRGHRASNVLGSQVVVTSSAIASSNVEAAAARRLGIPVVARVEMLAELARLKRTVTVSGSHGKTTTTSMVAMALRAAGADPTMVIGGQLANIRSNARLGAGQYLVAEADESDGSFLRLFPLVAVVTNVDTDHLDYHGTMERLENAFLGHLDNLPFYGAAVLCRDDARLRRLIPKVRRRVVTFGLEAGADWRARRLGPARPGELFAGERAALLRAGRRVGTLELKVSGAHNVSNALAAVAAGEFLGFDLKRLLAGLAEFSGVGRRLELLGRAQDVDFVDDYGHHPTEVAATLAAVCHAARSAPARRRVVVLFQPHRFSRTKMLHREFGPAFRGADAVYVADIYPAGENPIPGVTSRLILDSIRSRGIAAFPFSRTVDLARELRPGDIVLTLGAGDVWKHGVELLRRLGGRTLGTV